MNPYGHYNFKQANQGNKPAESGISVRETIGALNPTSDNLANYGIYGGAGALTGAGAGALLSALLGKSKLKGALIGGGLGAGAGVGVKALGDYTIKDQKKSIEDMLAKRDMLQAESKSLENILDKLRADSPARMGDGVTAKLLHAMDSLGALSTTNTPRGQEQALLNKIDSNLDERNRLFDKRMAVEDQDYPILLKNMFLKKIDDAKGALGLNQQSDGLDGLRKTLSQYFGS